jgi:two-component system, OmpR family, heavy metal sensor histidine kinase CusS
MFWKIADFNKSSFSLVNKMVILYWSAMMSIVLLVCIILFPTFEKVTHLYHANYHDTLLSQCIEKLIIAFLISGICSIFFAKLIARKGIKQLELLSYQINNITIDSLSTQIQIEKLPTELKSVGKSFNIMLEKLEKSVKHVSQFSSDIAHELRTPIHNLLNMNEIALIKPCSDDWQQEIFESNVFECRDLLKLIENLWFIAQSEHSHISINKIQLNIKNEINSIIDYYQSYADENHIEIIYQGDTLLHADKILFKRALSNLLSNALRYTSNGKILIKSEQHNHEVVVSIQDTGSGIEEKHLPQLFDRFYRADHSRSSKTGGLGLGLSIVKSIMDLHQGKIMIESQINRGTSVSLHFPLIP